MGYYIYIYMYIYVNIYTYIASLICIIMCIYVYIDYIWFRSRFINHYSWPYDHIL